MRRIASQDLTAMRYATSGICGRKARSCKAILHWLFIGLQKAVVVMGSPQPHACVQGSPSK